MLPDLPVATFLAACLIAFYAVNLRNLAKSHRTPRTSVRKAEVESPSGPLFSLAALGTLLLFVESGAYVILVLGGLQSYVADSVIQLHFPHDSVVQVAGLFLTASGYFLFIWSVIARGQYSTAWEMRENHKLVTWGPYHHIRHPSYTAYILLFTGLFLTLLNLAAAIPLLAIPGYVSIAEREERLLTSRFGKEYTKYQQTTGQFLPKLRKKRTIENH